MKKLLTSIFLLFQFSLFAQIQWAQVGTIWYYDAMEGFATGHGYVKFEVTKDTLLGGKISRKIQKTSFRSNGAIKDLGSEYTYMDNRKVYFWKTNHYYLLYDFSAYLNDSWILKSFGENWCGYDSVSRVIVKKTDYETISGVNIKSYSTAPDDTSKWVFHEKILENIGSLYYMFPIPLSCGIFDLYECGPLRCFYSPQIGTIHFKINNSTFAKCDTLFGTGLNEEIETNSVTIYPNPTNESFTISAKNEFIEQIEIVDSNGKCVNTISGNNKSEVLLSLPNQGTYFLKIKINKKYIYKKIIIL